MVVTAFVSAAPDVPTRPIAAGDDDAELVAALRQGDEAEARSLFLDALGRYRDLGDIRGMAECVAGLAGVIAVADPTRGVELFGAALAAIEGVGSHPNPSNEADYDHLLAWARERLGDEPVADALARGRTFTLEHAIGLARR